MVEVHEVKMCRDLARQTLAETFAIAPIPRKASKRVDIAGNFRQRTDMRHILHHRANNPDCSVARLDRPFAPAPDLDCRAVTIHATDGLIKAARGAAEATLDVETKNARH